jgi:uncharacterized protein YndB with AHSA1/START domain
MKTVVALGALAGAAAAAGFELVARGTVTVDLGIGRSFRPLGPIERTIAAPPEVVFDVIAAPYLGRTPRALRAKLDVWERSAEMVLAAHFTHAGRRLTTTVETVRFERPHRIDFRLVRGPVPHVTETFLLDPVDGAQTRFVYSGELGADLWAAGRWWGDRVGRAWEAAVRRSLDGIAAEAERRARR